MPTSTYDLIASNVLGSSAASVTFSSIPATYRDLVLVCHFKGALGNVTANITLNNDTNSNYSVVTMSADGSTTNSLAATVNRISFEYAGASSTNFLLGTMHLMDYSATDKHKTALVRNGNAAVGISANATRWASTSAVSSMQINASSVNNFAAGSSFYLYGIVS